MKKKLYSISILLLSAAVLSLSSCLKDDSRFTDFSKGTPIVEFNLGGLAYFGPDAITESTDTVVKKFAVSVASVTVPKTATSITLSVDNALITSYTAGHPGVAYLPMPANAFKIVVTNVTIPGGQRAFVDSVIIYKNKLDPSLSYMLPIKITSTSGGYTISGNMSVHYYHYIGNDFAGAYTHFFDRWGVPDTTNAAAKDNDHVNEGTEVFLPIDPSTFTAHSAYYTGIPYTVSFTKTGTGADARYSNFAVTFTADDIKQYFTDPGAGVVLGNAPIFDPATDPNKQYKFEEAIKLFRFYYTTGTRAVIDTYIRQ